MSPRTADHQRRGLAPLIVITAAAMVFAILLILVRLRWSALESIDHGAAAHLNSLIAGHPTLTATSVLIKPSVDSRDQRDRRDSRSAAPVAA